MGRRALQNRQACWLQSQFQDSWRAARLAGVLPETGLYAFEGGWARTSRRFGYARRSRGVRRENSLWCGKGVLSRPEVRVVGEPRILFLQPISGINTYELQSR